MPIEYTLLRDAPEPFKQCPQCGAPFESFLRGLVQSSLRRIFRRPYCAVICSGCRDIVGWEKPPRGKHE